MFQSIAVLVLLLALNAFFSAAEVALISVNQNRVKKKAEEGDKKSIRLKEIVENPAELLAAVQIGTSLIRLLAGALAALTFAGGLTDALIRTGIPVSPFFAKFLSIVGITIALSFFMLVFGELTPKRIAMKRTSQIANATVLPIRLFARFARPFVRIVSVAADFFVKLVGVDMDLLDEDVTEEEIRMMVDAGGETGSIDENEMEMINNIFEFDDKTAGDICTHRTDFIAIPIDAGEREILSLLSRQKYSRIPVYEDNIDNIVGVLHTKDVMKHIIHRTLQDVTLRSIMRKPYFVPFSKKTDVLFEEMQMNKIHLAIVVDEYGGTLGLVSMEDLIEEIMGNIFDEYDEEKEPDITPIDGNAYFVNGSTELARVSEFMGVELPDDYDTLSGFLVGQLGRIPEEGEQPELEFNGLLFKLFKVEEKRVASVIVCKL